MKKILISNLILQIILFFSNIFFINKLNDVVRLVLQSEGLKEIKINLLRIYIMGDITYIVNNYIIYIIAIAIILNLYFIFMYYIKENK
ncbi:hypothetical protein [Caloramator sp. Dgby_cultured_2]|uniref:hypothetical protein n=1 Tax=Caloramator sp. Dgby_cultured_2 TaxID=3029174 RepID=UPI00237D8674|nr:hypothetical protein [Caloramator sp. Dgby_cultured_2]WDU82770.1 hypothetical protein PWK10_14745 [Caloramator sp. Dgby_cultured_2]